MKVSLANIEMLSVECPIEASNLLQQVLLGSGSQRLFFCSVAALKLASLASCYRNVERENTQIANELMIGRWPIIR